MVSVQNVLEPICCVLKKTLNGAFPAWWSWQAVLNLMSFFYNNSKTKKKFQPEINILASLEVGRSNCLPYE